MNKTFYFGADYYPEHWPESRWAEDARLMQEAGFNVARLAEFAWSRMEPSKGQFDFAWLDRAIALLADHGIKTVLGTPTASPPPWVMAGPDFFIVNENGVRRTYGLRREYCPTYEPYRQHSVRITQVMADHYQANPHVIGWQIDNEFGDRCYCLVCQKAFQEWLERKYETLDNLNDQWGTVFWSHVYTDWCQIPTAAKTAFAYNPGLDLDYRRFMSDTYVAYQQRQIDVLRKTCPEQFITHNLMGFKYPNLDYFDLAKSLDFVSLDNYPRGFWDDRIEVDTPSTALAHDAMRSLKHKNHWVMEAQSGASGWDIVGMTPRPGEIRLWAYQGIAHGADGIVFFRWRTCRFGAEEYWHGILDHDGRPRRRYEEVKQMGQELRRIGDSIVNAEVRSEVAMLLSYDTRFAFQGQPNNLNFDYPAHFGAYYASLREKNIGVEIISPADDLTDYKLVIVPALYIVNEVLADKLRVYVEQGGTVIFTARSGVKDEANAVVNMPLPGLLAELCGIEVEEYDSLPTGVVNPLEFVHPKLSKNGVSGAASIWCEVLTPQSAEVVATYTQAYYAGQPAITINKIGQGKAIYVGTMGDANLAKTVVGWAVTLAGVEPLLESPADVEVTARWQDGRQVLFVLNHAAKAQRVALDGNYLDIISGERQSGPVTVAGKDVLILVAE